MPPGNLIDGRALAEEIHQETARRVAALQARGSQIMVLVGGVVPPQDYEALRAMGVAAIFGPGTHIPDAARSVLGLIRARLRKNEP